MPPIHETLVCNLVILKINASNNSYIIALHLKRSNKIASIIVLNYIYQS